MTTRPFRLLPLLLLLGLPPLKALGGNQASPSDKNAALPLSLTWSLEKQLPWDPPHARLGFTLTNEGKSPFPLQGWSLYFNLPRRVRPSSLGPGWVTEQPSADLQRFVPMAQRPPLPPGKSLQFTFEVEGWIASRLGGPAAPYLVFDDKPLEWRPLRAFRCEGLEGKDLRRAPEDKMKIPTPQERFAQNAALDRKAPACPVFPTPKSLTVNQGTFTLKPGTAVSAPPELTHEAAWACARLAPYFTNNAQDRPGLHLLLNALPGESSPEAYKLVVDRNNGITITAPSNKGIYYGLQSLASLLPPAASGNIALPCLEILDAPRFVHRGMHLDVARHFRSKAEVIRVMDLMASLKLNVLHFHISDDEGWRLEIQGLPELTAVGGTRGHGEALAMLPPTLGSGPEPGKAPASGYYRREDMIEILKAASERHLEVMLELEMPGHARAAIKAMEARAARLQATDPALAKAYLLQDPKDKSKYVSAQSYTDNVMDPGLPSTYTFITHVVNEVAKIYREAGVPLRRLHMGGDEKPEGAWKGSPACLEAAKELPSTDDLWYPFYDRVGRILQDRGIQLAGWEEAALRRTTLDGEPKYIPNPDFTGRGWQIFVWNNVIGWGQEDLAYRLANGGHQVVLAPVSNFYMDMAHEPGIESLGLNWAGYIDIDGPFRFIPLDYFRNVTRDTDGNPVDKKFLASKERLTAYGQSKILGLQGCLWSETLHDLPTLEKLLLPRLLGLAERAWAPDPAWTSELKGYNRAWSAFLNRICRYELAKLPAGWHFHIPPPGLSVQKGWVHANHVYPDVVLRYTEDGSEPTEQSRTFSSPVRPKGTSIKVAAFTSQGLKGPSASIRVK